MKKSTRTLELEVFQNYSVVFDKIIDILPKNGFKLISYDKESGYINASAGMSILSWGANINFTIKDFQGSKTLIHIISTLKLQYDFEKQKQNTLKAAFADGYNESSDEKHQRYFDKIKLALSEDFNLDGIDNTQSVGGVVASSSGKFEMLKNHMIYLYKADLNVLQLLGYQMLITIIIYSPYIFIFQGRKYIALPLLAFHLIYSFCVTLGVKQATNNYSSLFFKLIVRLFFLTYIVADILLISLTLAIL